VGVPEAFQLALDASAVALRRVGIRSRVGEDVVPAVVGYPTNRSPLIRHRAECDEDELDRSAGGERLVGEEAMEADCHAVADQNVEHHSEEHVAEVDSSAPNADHAKQEGEERDSDDQGGDHACGQPGWAIVLLDRMRRRTG
jgi:hypothetical protein